MSSDISSAPDRIEIIDAIRGMAIFGILLANIRSWSGYRFILFEDIRKLPFYELDALFNQLHYWLIDGKFYAIFSLLFGAGFGIQYLKNRGNLDEFIPRYRRRVMCLLLFGVMHALFWSGDILTLYALLALVLIMFRNIELPWLLPLSLCLLASFSLSQIYALYLLDPGPELLSLAHSTYPEMTPQEISQGYGQGGFAEFFSVNLHNLYWRWMDFFPNGRFTRVLGFFVLGFYLVRSGFFQTQIYSWLNLFLFFTIGLAATWVAWITDSNISSWSTSGSDVILKLIIVLGQCCLAMGYICLLAQASRAPAGRLLAKALSLVGRMAFTSYLLQTAIGIGLFYGVGFGLWGTMGLAQLWLLSVFIFLGQVVLCGLWLHWYRQGPMEWLWGCMTNGKLQPNLRH